jgi:hypothetical protein
MGQNIMLKPMIGGIVGTLLTLSLVTHAQAQPPSLLFAQAFPSASASVSPLELQQFVQAIKQLQKVEMETREKMAEALKSERLSPERFQEIGQRRSNPDAPVSSQISANEQERFDKALAKIQTIQREATPKQNRAITLQGLTVERFNQIGTAIEQNPALRQQLRNQL